MAFCSKCGAQLAEETKFCPACGAAVEDSQNSSQETAQQETTKENNKQTNFGEKVANLNNTADTTSEYDNDDITKNKAMAILSYLWILVLIPILAAKDSKFARYHANQGLVLLITELAYSIVNAILTAILGAIFPINWWTLSHGAVYGIITTILNLISLVFVVLLIIGIVNAANGKAKELPIIGKFKILK